jgi:hypothetical protein
MSDYDYYKFPNQEEEIDEIESETENDMTITEEENRELAENFKKIYSVLKKNTIQLKNNIYEQMMEQNPFEQSVQLSDNYKKILQNIYDIIKLIYKNPNKFSLDSVNNYEFPENIRNDVHNFIKWVLEFRKSSNSVENTVISENYFETSFKTFPYSQK